MRECLERRCALANVIKSIYNEGYFVNETVKQKMRGPGVNDYREHKEGKQQRARLDDVILKLDNVLRHLPALRRGLPFLLQARVWLHVALDAAPATFRRHVREQKR